MSIPVIILLTINYFFILQLKSAKNNKSSGKRNANKYVVKRTLLIFSAIPDPVFSSSCTARSKTPNDSVSFSNSSMNINLYKILY